MLTVIGGSLFIALPMGLLMALVLTVVALGVWRLPVQGVPEPETAEATAGQPDYAAEGVRQAESGPSPRPS